MYNIRIYFSVSFSLSLIHLLFQSRFFSVSLSFFSGIKIFFHSIRILCMSVVLNSLSLSRFKLQNCSHFIRPFAHIRTHIFRNARHLKLFRLSHIHRHTHDHHSASQIHISHLTPSLTFRYAYYTAKQHTKNQMTKKRKRKGGI